jgi:RNA polymerase sigma factor (sigma-70 family)
MRLENEREENAVSRSESAEVSNTPVLGNGADQAVITVQNSVMPHGLGEFRPSGEIYAENNPTQNVEELGAQFDNETARKILSLYSTNRSLYIGLSRKLGASSWQEAEELVQDVVLSVLQVSAGLDPAGIDYYLKKALSNRTISRGRRIASAHRVFGEHINLDEGDNRHLIEDPRKDFDRTVYDTLYKAIEELSEVSPEQRKVMELTLLGLRSFEIADVLGRTQETIKMLKFRAVKRLREEHPELRSLLDS